MKSVNLNKYFISYKIATVAELIEAFEYEGYKLTSYDPEWWKSDGWVASKIIKAKSAGEARFEFIKGLIPLVEQFSVISQCAFRFTANSYIIYKLNNNPHKIFYFYYVRQVEPTGLHFNHDEIAQLPKFSKIKNKTALLYIMESANVTTFYAKLSMLIMAVEGLAGEIVVEGKVMTNKVILKEILGEELFKKLYPYREGLRNILFHGKAEDHSKFEGLVDTLYSQIRSYLRLKYDIQLSENVVHPQRNPNDNFQFAATYEAFKNEPVLDMKLLEQAFDDSVGPNHKAQELFEWKGSPDNY